MKFEASGKLLTIYLFIFGTHDALDHLASFPSSGEMFSWSGTELPTTPFGLGTFPLSSSNLGSSWTITNHFRGKYGIYVKTIKKNQKFTTCN
jgi:hypothetical protein